MRIQHSTIATTRHLLVATILWVGLAEAAKPIFENGTPVGFAPQDSTTKQDFVLGEDISIRVDLNQAATTTYPVIGNFHTLEKADQVGTTATDGMQVDIAMVDVVPFGTNDDTTTTAFPVIHMAWIEEVGTSQGSVYSAGITPVYEVKYAQSVDGGASFSASFSVSPSTASGTVTYHPMTTGNEFSFSTLDLEVDSAGNPRVVYAFISTADRARKKNVYFSYSEDGGGSWKTPIVVNDASTVGEIEGRNAAFPRMAIDDRDDIFISYVRGLTSLVSTSDVMVAKVNRIPDPFTILPVGETGGVGTGGVRIAPDGTRQMGPDLAIGDADALHAIYYDDAGNQIEHKRVATDTTWADVSSTGWNQTAVGATVSAFNNDPAGNVTLEKGAVYYFPTAAIDRNRTPDRVYGLFKLGVPATDEGIYFNQYDDDGTTGAGATWGSVTSVWSSFPSPLFSHGINNYEIELDWEITERVSAIVDDRLDDRGDLHIAFSAGYSSGGEHDIYYSRYNGTSWTLPEKVADDDSDAGTEDGIAAADVFLLSPSLAHHPDNENVYLAFAGGTGEGVGIDNVTDVNHHAYFKVLGRNVTSEDESSPVGAFEYNLTYSPINPQSITGEVTNNPVFVHAADPTNGRGLGAAGNNEDGFLTGDWEAVATSLVTDNNKFFEGKVNEDATSTNEWGDDDDKNGLLVKLNVLGSDSSTNIQLVNNSTASAAGTGQGARALRINIDPAFSSFVTPGTFFMLGADIDIVVSNNAPTVNITDPDGAGDTANTSYTIRYDLQDSDDDLSGNLKADLYFYPSGGLDSVQEIRIFATLIADENDVSSNNSSGTDDLTEGANQDYTWDDPPDDLQSSALFASIFKAQSSDYYIYLVADDGKNPAVFAVSPGTVTIKHVPIVQQIDPIEADVVDTGVRTGIQANPYDLDYNIVDYDDEARVQLFYASVTGITSLSVAGVWPNQRFALGKSLSGYRGRAITDSTFLTSHDHEFTWDVTDSVCAATTCTPGVIDSLAVEEGGYYLYAVATDSVDVTVGNSTMTLTVKHSPSFVFFEPPIDTQRDIDTGSQPVYTIQWQKGPGDSDRDNDATISLYFTTDNPAVTDHSTDSGASSTSLTSDADTKLIVSGLTEDGDGSSDIYVWDFRDPPNAVPVSGQRVWVYAVITDGTNTTVSRGGALEVTHNPFVLLETRMPDINQGDVVSLKWDDYMVDDASGTDDAVLRLYASSSSSHTTLLSLEAALVGEGGAENTYIVNSSTGRTTGTITSIAEADSTFNWDTRTSSFSFPQGTFSVYAGISADGTFSDNAATGGVSKSSNQIVVGSFSGTNPNATLSPTKVMASAGDILTFEILVQSGGLSTNLISVVVDMGTSLLSIVNPGSPFTDLGEVFTGGTETDNSSSGNTVSYAKQKAGGEIVGTTVDPARLVSFKVEVLSGLSGLKKVKFDTDLTSFSIVGNSTPLKKSSGMSIQDVEVEALDRGQIEATVLLEGRASPIGDGDHTSLLDVHLRRPGSTTDITDATYISSNDDDLATADTVEVATSSSGDFSLIDIPSGRYVLAVKDTSHLSGRTDTLTIRSGETLVISSSEGFFSSDVRGDASFILGQSGQELKAGDVTEDNEIDEDDINAIDAAWGSAASADNFKQADLNNDGRVGVEDLTVTTSNISNSTGFGAPPVFKRAAIPRMNANTNAGLEILAPEYSGEWRQGDEIELVFLARDLDDLAGYSINLEYDPTEMDLLDVVRTVRGADVFSRNPEGFFRRVRQDGGRISIAAARRGKEWSASGEGELLRIRVQLAEDGFPKSLIVHDGKLLSSNYERTELQLLNDPYALSLPQEFGLGQNYPNPFNPETTIPFNVPVLAGLLERTLTPVSVEIFNVLGQQIRTLAREDMSPGYYRLSWDGTNSAGQQVATGLYLYRVQVGDQMRVRKMTLLR